MTVSPLLKFKSAVGTSWAGRVIHNQHHAPRPNTGRIEVDAMAVTHSVRTKQDITHTIRPIDDTHQLVAYHDGTALIVSFQNTVATILPAILYFPERVTINGKKFGLSLSDVINSHKRPHFTSPRFTQDEAALIRDALSRDLEAALKKARSLHVPAQPWFMAGTTQTPEDAHLLNATLKGLEMMGMTDVVKGRMLKPTGKPGPLRIDDRRFKSARALGEATALRAMFDHPAFPVPPARQVNQGWDQILSSSDAYSFTNIALCDNAPLLSAHEKTEALHLAQKALTDTNTTLDDIKRPW